MQFIIFLFTILSFNYSFAQISSTKYFYQGRCEAPDFAALAVLEKQDCNISIPSYENVYFLDYFGSKEFRKYKEQICTSHYRILHVLDAASGTLKKEHLEAKEKLVPPYFRHRPMLIFGKKKNGIIQIEGHEETRTYFDDFNSDDEPISELGKSSPLPSEPYIYALHSFGSPYYNVKNLDSADMMFYGKYFVPSFKVDVDAAGKDFSKLLLRLIYNRTPIKATKIKNDFAALVTIMSARPASDPKQANLYELRVAMETIFKNDAKIDSNVTIYIDKARLPLYWSCQWMAPENRRMWPFYLFGDLKDGSLVIDSLVPTYDTFVFGDTIYDISMGLSLKELLSYFLPSNISFEDLKFNQCWEHTSYYEKPKSLIKVIEETEEKLEDFFRDKHKLRPKIKRNVEYPFVEYPFTHAPAYLYTTFRCRTGVNWEMVFPSPEELEAYYYPKSCNKCDVRFKRKGEGIWGRKW